MSATVPRLVHRLSIVIALLIAPAAGATNNLFNQLPNQPQSCNTCHANGPGSERNAFGLQVEMHLTGDANTGTLDWAALCDLDADNDGSSNGAELGDPCCSYMGGTPPSTTTADPNNAAVLAALRCEGGMIVVDAAPDGWVCPRGWFGSGDGCDCGCGVLDDDCADSTIGSCESNGCPNADDGDVPNPGDPVACIAGDIDSDGGTPGGGPTGWTCNAGWYGNGDGCDCGCGIVDEDCADETVDSCTSNGCPGASGGEVPDPEDPTQCITPGEGGLFNCEQTGGGATALAALMLGVLAATRGRGRSSRRRQARA